jgi:hypothetical protein
VTGRRIGAVVLAVALVVGAFVIRRSVIEDDDDNPTTDGTEVDEPDRGEATVLFCVTELSDVCDSLAASHDELDITVEDAGATLDRLAALDDAAAVPLWITLDPFPAMVDALRQNDPLGFESQALGSSQLAIAFRAGDKETAIATFCESDTTPLWRCLGEQAGADWSTFGTSSISGTLRPSLGDVTNSALGLMSFASAVASYFGAVDIDRAQFDDTSFSSWLRRLSRVSLASTEEDTTPLARLAVRPAPDAAATAMFEVNTLDATGDRFEVNYSEPQMWIQAVLATPAGVAAPNGLAADVTSALEAAGWDPAAAADGPTSSTSTLLALRQLWNDYTT